jgi:hypothetical protein
VVLNGLKEGLSMLDLAKLRRVSFENLIQQLGNSEGEIILNVPCEAIGFSQEYSDVAEDYLVATTVGEIIAPFCIDIKADEVVTKANTFIRFTFQPHPKQVKSLAKELKKLSRNFNLGLNTESGLYELVEKIEEDLFEQQLTRFPSIATDFMANWIMSRKAFFDPGDVFAGSNEATVEDGISWEEDSEYDTNHPEYYYGFWKSFFWRTMGQEYYVSSEDVFIAPLDASLKKILENEIDIDFNFETLEEASFRVEDQILPDEALPKAIAFTKTISFSYNYDLIKNAKLCAREIVARNPGGGLAKSAFLSNTGNNNKCFLSRNGKILVLQDEIAQYIFIQNVLK